MHPSPFSYTVLIPLKVNYDKDDQVGPRRDLSTVLSLWVYPQLCSTNPTDHINHTLYNHICMGHRMYEEPISFLQRRENTTPGEDNGGRNYSQVRLGKTV